ncbi:MAG: hypothetical protein IJ813_03335 [Bacteroidales bacterium]|nr:hypothetical protein [Bacteroidales bacterium]
MRRQFLHILTLIAVLLPLSCTKEAELQVSEEKPAVDYEGREVMVYFGVETPEPATKAMGENPDIESLHVAVFGSSGYLKEYKLATPVDEYVSVEGVANKKGYKVPLSITSSRIRVHLIANGPSSLEFDYESNVMSKLSSMGGEDAYWQRILLDNGIYADTEAEGYYATPPQLVIDPDFDLDTDGTTHKMALIPLIRNFAKITVKTEADSNFEAQSFAVINVPDRGSIAPYNPSNGNFIMNYEDYPTLADLSAVYPGNMPSATTIDKSYPSETDFTNLTNGVVAASGAVYMYERPIPTADATILIVKGTYTDPDTHEANTGYYKIDLMDGGAYLPILRNFRYEIHIKKVHRKGKSTVAGAINGAGSADISADISTASQVNISDGQSAISVEYTEKTLAIGGTYTLGITFTSDVINGTVDNTLVTYELRAPEANGAVIADVSDISYDASTGTLSYTTTDVDPTKMKSQVIRVIGTSGTSRLYRDITIRLLPQQQMTVTCIPEIEQAEGTPQTVTVSIPKDLPQSIFPLQFKVEVAAKSLTPNAGDLPVEPGNTIVSGQSGRSYQFIKTVSYNDYIAGYMENNSVFTCEFKSIIPESDSYIYVYNPYFALGSTSFTTFEKRYFSFTRFSTSAAVNEDDPVNFFFVMDAEHEPSDKLIPEDVHVYLTGLVPDLDQYPDELQRVSGNHYVYTVPENGIGTQTLHFLSTGVTENYAVELRANYYEDHELVNATHEFTGLSFGTVYSGRGWPTTFRFTIPSDFQMPAVGYIDIELGLTNLEPNNDSNIITSGGKYYYRTSSTGTKTLNLKTADNRTEAVGVQLKHGSFVTAVGTQSTRNNVTIAAQKVQFTGNYAGYYYDNTVRCYSDSGFSTQVGSFTGGYGNRAYCNGAFTFTAPVDATQTIYMRYQYQTYRGTYNFTSSATALDMFNGTSCAVTVTQ